MPKNVFFERHLRWSDVLICKSKVLSDGCFDADGRLFSDEGYVRSPCRHKPENMRLVRLCCIVRDNWTLFFFADDQTSYLAYENDSGEAP